MWSLNSISCISNGTIREMIQNNIDFTDQLIKGKIAEIVFEQMIHQTKGYTILEFGYEKVVRQLANERKSDVARETIEIVRRASDFAIVNEKTHDITLVEVKYMYQITPKYVKQVAQNIKKSWKRASLFIVSPEGFFFGAVSELVDNGGHIKPFHHNHIPKNRQREYLALINKYIKSE